LTNSKNTVGSVAALWRYPVKSMKGEHLESVPFTERGMLGDRAYALVDKATGKVASAKNPRKWPTLLSFGASYLTPPREQSPMPPVVIALPGGGSVNSDSSDASRVLASALDRDVALVCAVPESPMLEEYWPDVETLAHRDEVTDEAMPAQTFFDCAPVHILTLATLGKLSELYPEGGFEPKRFRPNLLIAPSAPDACFMENEWVGCTLAIGPEVRIKVSGNTGRCVMTTLAQDGLPRDLGILKTAALYNQAHVGVYGTVVRGGIARHEDRVSVVE
jgi:uncharacterized protein